MMLFELQIYFRDCIFLIPPPGLSPRLFVSLPDIADIQSPRLCGPVRVREQWTAKTKTLDPEITLNTNYANGKFFIK